MLHRWRGPCQDQEAVQFGMLVFAPITAMLPSHCHGASRGEKMSNNDGGMLDVRVRRDDAERKIPTVPPAYEFLHTG
jgi:hypothetical protein